MHSFVPQNAGNWNKLETGSRDAPSWDGTGSASSGLTPVLMGTGKAEMLQDYPLFRRSHAPDSQDTARSLANTGSLTLPKTAML